MRAALWSGNGSRSRLVLTVILASLLLTVYHSSELLLWLERNDGHDKITGPTVGSTKSAATMEGSAKALDTLSESSRVSFTSLPTEATSLTDKRNSPRMAVSERSIGYLVKTDGCTIPEYSARDPTIKKHLRKPEGVECNPHGMPPLTYTAGPHVHINLKQSVLRRYHLKQTTLSCCYKEITRVTEQLEGHSELCDDKYKLGACVPIDSQTGVSPLINSEGVLVTCSSTNHPKKTVYKNVHYFFPHSKAKRKIDEFKKNRENGSTNPLNFMIIGIDSVSRQNMKRYMPETFRYLTHDIGALDFKGYNKVADNTDPNVTPIITGVKAEHFLSHNLTCYKFQKDNLDECPFIWKNFSTKGYVTVYAEDAPKIGLYHYHKIGFVQEPTDYYIRPYFMVSEKEIGRLHGPTRRCQGLRQSPEVIYDHALRALDTFNKEAPVFGYYWTASTTHGENELTAALDHPTVDFFRKFVKKGYNNNTIVLFISDHGMRFGSIRSTYLGALEERLPFVMMLFPPWFRKVYPATWHNLEINRQRLINNYDLHLTIVDILGEFYEESSNPKTYFDLGQSLFMEVPQNRTCESCGIPTHYCACQTSSIISTKDRNVIDGADFVVKILNHGMSKHPKCAQLDLKRIVSARVVEHKHNLQKTMKKKSVKIWQTYSIVIETKPGGALFEGTLLQGAQGWELTNDVSRINLYGNQSHCVEDVVLKMYCYCLDNISR